MDSELLFVCEKTEGRTLQNSANSEQSKLRTAKCVELERSSLAIFAISPLLALLSAESHSGMADSPLPLFACIHISSAIYIVIVYLRN